MPKMKYYISDTIKINLFIPVIPGIIPGSIDNGYAMKIFHGGRKITYQHQKVEKVKL